MRFLAGAAARTIQRRYYALYGDEQRAPRPHEILASVHLPLLRPSLLAAALLVFVGLSVWLIRAAVTAHRALETKSRLAEESLARRDAALETLTMAPPLPMMIAVNCCMEGRPGAPTKSEDDRRQFTSDDDCRQIGG